VDPPASDIKKSMYAIEIHVSTHEGREFVCMTTL
jgi:hypothetical protein